jgi:arylsulfatase
MTKAARSLRRVAGLAVAALAVLALSACRRPEPPSLLLVTIDTLRADHLSVYGYPWPTSPGLEALAERGVVFDWVVAPVPETAPSCAALLTGRWPVQLGVRGNAQPLRPRFETLAELLAAAGYETAAFVSGIPLDRRLSGLHQGFDHYDDRMPDPRGRTANVQRLAEKTTAAARSWLASRPEGPFFLWLHYYDPHGDYSPGPPYDAMFGDRPAGPEIPLTSIPGYQRAHGTDAAVYTARYDGEIRKVDDQLAGLLDEIETARGLERTLVAVTADHGESLTEHGYFFDHGNELYLPSLRIPLILAGAGVPPGGRRIGGSARTVDVLPTLLELLGQRLPEGLAGTSLVDRLDGAAPSFPETLSEARFKTYRALTVESDVEPKLAVRDDRFTVILKLGSSKLELYDRRVDGGETRDLMTALADDPAGAELRRALEENVRARQAAAAAGQRPAPRVFTPEIRRRIEEIAASRSKTSGP